MPINQWYSDTAKNMIRATGTKDPRDVIIQSAAKLLEDAEIDKPPVDLRIVGSFQRVKDIQFVMMKHAGRLIPDGHNFIIQVNASHKRGKQNFTIAHEIGHTLLFEYQRKPHIIEDFVTGRYLQGQEEEYLCDTAAAELLMPTALFKPLAAAKGPHLDTIMELAHTFRASREATAIQLVKTNLWPCAVAFWHYVHTPEQAYQVLHPTLAGFEDTLPSKRLRLRYAIRSSTFGHYLPSHLAAQTDGCLARCFVEDSIVNGEEEFELQKGQFVNLHVLAAPVNFISETGITREVLSLLMSSSSTLLTSTFQSDLWAAMEE